MICVARVDRFTQFSPDIPINLWEACSNCDRHLRLWILCLCGDEDSFYVAPNAEFWARGFKVWSRECTSFQWSMFFSEKPGTNWAHSEGRPHLWKMQLIVICSKSWDNVKKVQFWIIQLHPPFEPSMLIFFSQVANFQFSDIFTCNVCTSNVKPNVQNCFDAEFQV